VRTLLGVESPGNYSGCSSAVGNAFYSHLDKYNTPTQYYVAALLERDIPILIYAGECRVLLFITLPFSSNIVQFSLSPGSTPVNTDDWPNYSLSTGTYDWQCNWVGNYRWTDALEWSGHDAFSSQPLRDWTVNGTVAGKTRSADGLTFATIYGAGHMVRGFTHPNNPTIP
jgi:carboxypeptidase C (cathepsin A)